MLSPQKAFCFVLVYFNFLQSLLKKIKKRASHSRPVLWAWSFPIMQQVVGGNTLPVSNSNTGYFRLGTPATLLTLHYTFSAAHPLACWSHQNLSYWNDNNLVLNKSAPQWTPLGCLTRSLLVCKGLGSMHNIPTWKHPHVLATSPNTNSAAAQPVVYTCLSSKINKKGPEKPPGNWQACWSFNFKSVWPTITAGNFELATVQQPVGSEWDLSPVPKS